MIWLRIALLFLFLVWGLTVRKTGKIIAHGFKMEWKNQTQLLKLGENIQKRNESLLINRDKIPSHLTVRSKKSEKNIVLYSNIGDKRNDDPKLIGSKHKTRVRRSMVDPCARFGTCDYVSTLPTMSRYCHCDEKCEIYDDCCPGRKLSGLKDIDTHNKGKYFKCLRHDASNKGRMGTVVLVQCLNSGTSPDFVYNCGRENIANYGAWVSDKDGNVYMNKFCALCNNISVYDYYSVRIHNIKRIAITKESNKTQNQKLMLTNDPNVKLEYIPPPGLNPRSCLINDNLGTASDVCLSYGVNPVISNNIIYRNYYCSGNTDISANCIGAIENLGSDNWYALFPMTVLFQFHDGGGSECTEVRNDVCFGEEIFSNYRVNIRFSATVQNAEFVPLTVIRKAVLLFTLSVNNSELLSVVELFSMMSSSENMSKIVTVDTKIALTKNLSVGVLKYEKLLQNVRRTFNIQDKSTNNTIAIDFLKADTYYAHTIDDVLLINWNQNMKNIFEEDKMVSKKEKTMLERHNSICKHLAMYIIAAQNMTVLSVESIKCLTTGFIGVHNLTHVAKVIATYFGFVLSIISLIIFILMNRKFNRHQSIAGSNLENVCMTLLVASTLFVLGIGFNDHPIACKVMAVLLHYFWLTVFTFMSIAVICMVMKIRKLEANIVNVNSDSMKTRLALRGLGMSIPGLFVATPFILSAANVLPYNDMNQKGVCFPTAFPVNVIFVSGPILFSITLNTICLICMIFHIRQNKVMTARLTKSKSFNEVTIYLRFSILAGIPWVLGILAAIVRVDVVDFIFVLLCSLQGIFLVVANITSNGFRRHLNLRNKNQEKDDGHSKDKNEIAVDKF